MKKKKILLFTYTDLSADPIVIKQINWLAGSYDLCVVCSKPNNIEGVTYIKYPAEGFLKRNTRNLFLLLRLYRLYEKRQGNRELIAELSGKGFDLVIVHHLKLLPLVFNIVPKAKVLFYAHEYYMNMYDHSLYWRVFIKKYFNWLAGKYLHLCNYTITVNESIKDMYEKRYGIKCDYIHNAVEYEDIMPSKTDPGNIKIVHHGLASTSRKPELMIELMKYLAPKFSLTLIFQTNSVVNDLYIRKIRKAASVNNRIIFRNRVPYNEVAKMGNEYDIGLFFMPPTTINVEYSLGHKIFQYIQSRLMLVVSPLPEMKKIVENYGLGIVSDDYDVKKLAERLNKLTPEEIMQYKNHSNLYAKELSCQPGKEKFLAITAGLISGNPE
jgi:glycosyltransferase involved in cell wall biosynthesis